MHRFDHNSYDTIMLTLNMNSLEMRTTVADTIFLFKAINNFIDCPTLLELINFNICSRPLRCVSVFHIDLYRSNLKNNDPITRVCCLANNISHCVDFFSGSINQFKNNVHKTIHLFH